jgi:AraC-like DNA-binding protein
MMEETEQSLLRCPESEGEERQETMLLRNPVGAIVPVLCGTETWAPDRCIGPMHLGYYLVVYVVEGRGCFTADDRQYVLRKGQTFVARPGELVRWESDNQQSCTVAWVGFEAAGLVGDDDFVLNRQDVFTIPGCRRLFEEMTACTDLRPSLELRLCGKICEMLAVMTDDFGEIEPAVADYVGRAKNYIHANYARDVSVQGIARNLGLSRSYFSALFSREEGISPQEYLVDYRLRKAAELIGKYGLRPGEAAAASGYTDVFTFSKMFKKKFGVSPGKYQNGDEDQPE